MPSGALCDGNLLIFRRVMDVLMEQGAVYGSFYLALGHRRRWTRIHVQRFSFLCGGDALRIPFDPNGTRLVGLALPTQTDRALPCWQQTTHEGEAFSDK